MEFPNIQIHGCQFHKLLEGALIASKISITEPRIEIFSDSNLPVDPKAYKNFPQESLLKASMGIRVDTIVVKNGTLKYENIPLNKTTTGKIDFDQMEAVFLNITNDTNKIAQNHILEIQAEARLYNKHIIKQHFWINLKSPAGDFTFTGSAANIPFAELNSFFTPALHITFEQGVINSLDYRITANHKTAKGVLTLQYEDIDFSLLNDKKEKKKILSELIDIFLVAENNIKGEKGFKKGVVDAGRDTRRSFFNFWWSAIQTGIASSVFSEKAINNIKKKSKEKNKQLD